MDFMNTVLIIGSGGREHAILKAFLRSNRPLCLYAYPGNPGMENDGCMIVDQPISSWEELADWGETSEIDLTIVGPETPLVEGIVDLFTERGLAIFGPSKMAARLEGSKTFSKQLMEKYKIPTASYAVFSTKASALAWLDKNPGPIVVKFSGLAAGKGVTVCDNIEQAKAALIDIFDKKAFGSGNLEVVLEERLIGEEASVFVLTDGRSYKILPVAQDHKPVGDGDTGPNTGGMGAYAPAPLVDAALLERIDNEIVKPTFTAMKKEGAPYKGLLYCGLMITAQGPKVIEYNCRFGDPETQVVLPLIDCDWYDVFMACTNGTLRDVSFSTHKGYCVSVVLASKGYPGAYKKGIPITGVDRADHSSKSIDVYHAGTAHGKSEGSFVTNGGRVLAVSAWSDTLEQAIIDAYCAVDKIDFEGMIYRKDIAAKGLKRLAAK